MCLCVCAWSVAVICSMDSKSCDEDVDHHDDEHQTCSQVFHEVQLLVFLLIIQVPSNCEQKQNNTQLR